MKRNVCLFVVALLFTISISSVNLLADTTTSSLPTFSANTTAPTGNDVIVTITYPSAAVHKQYRIGGLNYRDYDGPVIMTSNGIIYARWINAAGNISPETSYSVTNIDKKAPTGKIVINNGDSTTYSQTVTLSITASDAVQMLIWNEDNQYTQAWRTYSTMVYWTLSSGDGTKTVHVKFKDALGNISATYTETIKLAVTSRPMAPTFNLISGTYNSAQTLSIYSPYGTSICYTLDGTEPDKKALWYTAPILISSNTTVKAKAYKNGFYSDTNMIIITVNITAQGTPPSTPGASNITVNPVQGIYGSLQMVSVIGESGAVIRYTLDNSEPAENSSIYYSPIYIDKTTTLKARAYKNGAAGATSVNVYIIGASTDVNSMYTRAKVAYNSGRYDDAITILNQTLSIYSTHEDSIILLADCYLKKGDTVTAKEKLKAIMAANNSPKIANKYVEICTAKGDYKEAKQKILDLLSKYPNEDYLYKTAAALYDKMKVRGTRMFVDGDEVDFSRYDDVYPRTYKGRTLVPVRALCEALGARVEWNEELQYVVISMDGKRIVLASGSIFAQVNGVSKKLEIPATIYGGRLMVPVKFVSEHLGKHVNTYTSGETTIVSITK